MKKIIIFGTGINGERVYKNISKRKVTITACMDNNSAKWGERFCGIEIISPMKIEKLDYDFIVISTSAYWKNVYGQLLSMGVTKEKILVPYGYFRNSEKKKYEMVFGKKGLFDLYYYRRKRYEDFKPSILGLLTDPNFFSRKALYEAIKENSNWISGKVLDFGCGTKPYKSLFNAKEYVGVEINVEDNKKQKDVVYYDGKKIPFKNEYFDSIVTSEVMEHVINIEEIVKELHRVLKKDGVALITVPFVYPRHCWPNDYRRYTYEGIKEILIRNGFEIISCRANAGYVESITELKNIYLNKIVNKGCICTLETALINIEF